MFVADEPLRDPGDAFGRLLQYSLPVLAGLAQASSSWAQFGTAYFAGIAARRPVVPVLVLLLALLILAQLPGLWKLIRGRDGGEDGKNLLTLILVSVPALFVFSKFREQVIEPRYLLPLYSAGPILAACWVTRQRWIGFAAPLFVAGFLVLNSYSIAALDPRLSLPESATSSNPTNRAELATHLLAGGHDRIYTDYWLAYSMAFESGERDSAIGGVRRIQPIHTVRSRCLRGAGSGMGVHLGFSGRAGPSETMGRARSRLQESECGRLLGLHRSHAPGQGQTVGQQPVLKAHKRPPTSSQTTIPRHNEPVSATRSVPRRQICGRQGTSG